MTQRCQKCYFYGHRTDTCDYILVTGHRRGCPPDRCIRFEPSGGRDRRRPALTAKQLNRLRQMKLLHGRGLTDPQIAELVGVHQQTVFMWRKKNGLPANAKFGGDRKI